MPNKLTDTEIKKALECCSSNVLYEQCVDCPYEKYLEKGHTCIIKATKNALDLINRLQAENKKLKMAIKNFKATKIRLRNENEELAYKLGCLLCHATGGKLSKHTYPLGTMESYVNDTIQEYCEEAIEEAKAEAYKEFAERLKKESYERIDLTAYVEVSDINNLLNELVGDNNV